MSLGTLAVGFLLAAPSQERLPSEKLRGPAERHFREGNALYLQGDHTAAAHAFRESAARVFASGTLHNLGNAEWNSGRPGAAILAWQQALWVDPRNASARESLHFARAKSDLDEPKLAWFEACSEWLSFNSWFWLASCSGWMGLTLVALSCILPVRRRDWLQSLAAGALAVFLLSIPGMAGVLTRQHLGVILPKDTPLRLTPTTQGEVITLLPSGESVRLGRQRGSYRFVRTRHIEGWINRDDVGCVVEPRRL